MPLFETLNSTETPAPVNVRENLYATFRQLTEDFTDEELAKLVEHTEMTRFGIMARRASKSQS